MAADEPSLVERAVEKVHPWLNQLAKREAGGHSASRAVSRDHSAVRARYLTDGTVLYRIVAMLDVPVAAVILADCRTLAERLCTSAELRAMRLGQVGQ